ncbi:MAG TPA: hypothetical protein VGZ51_00080, partial [Actinomycetota bacterium]|nr:hypothetical protein [Actinomycetota bacterium]
MSRSRIGWIVGGAAILAVLLVLGLRLTAGGTPDVETNTPPQMPALASEEWAADYYGGADESEEEGEEEELENRQDWALARFGAPTPAEYHAALDQAAAIGTLTEKKYPSLTHTEWSLVGPTNVGGRITDLVVDPTTPGTIYTAAAAGGVWKSTNADSTPFTLQSAWGDQMIQPVGALAITPDGTLYAGTGEANPNIPSWPGTGIYKSTDGGANWTNIGLETSGTIGEIAIDPTNPNRLFVAANGYLFTPGGERGLYRSEDAGQTWELVLAGANGNTGAVDVAIHPQNPNRVYAAMWDHRREPCCRALGGVGSGLFRSDDGGETWTRLETITNPGNTELSSSSDLGRLGIALASSSPDRVYVIATTSNSTGISGAFRGFYWSNDGGDT